MKKLTCTICLLFMSFGLFAQGFGPTPINWTTPTGGQNTGFGVNCGFVQQTGYAYSNLNSQSWATSDMNGDGLPDLIVTGVYNSTLTFTEQFGANVNPYWKVYLNNGTGLSTSAINWTTPIGGQYTFNNISYGYNYINAFANGSPNSQTWNMMDMDGDQRPDLLVLGQYVTGVSDIQQFSAGTAPYWKVYHNTGTGFSLTPTIWNTPVGGTFSSAGVNLGFTNIASYACTNNTNCQSWALSDFNGDKKTDLIITSQHNTTSGIAEQFGANVNPYYKVYLNTGSGFASTPLNWSTPIGGRYSATNYSYGYNVISSIASNVSDSSQSWAITDIDGDELPDLIVTSRYNLSLANTFQYGAGSTPYWRVYHNTGNSFSPSFTTWNTPIGGIYTSAGQTQGYTFPTASGFNFSNLSQTWTIMDLDADKKPELVVAAVYSSSFQGYQQFGVGVNPCWQVYYNSGNSFATQPIIWPTPIGGHYTSGNLPYGYTYFYSYALSNSNSCQSWIVNDINGDKKPDLIVTSQYDTTLLDPQQFGVPSNPYWKVYLNTATTLGTSTLADEKSAISAFPNPFTNGVFLQSDKLLIGKTFSIFNIEGKVLRRNCLISEYNYIDLSRLSSGLYFLQIDDEKLQPIKLVKQ